MGAEQLGQGTMFGAVTLSCCAHRMLRLLLLKRRFGTATVLLLLRFQPSGECQERRESRVHGLLGSLGLVEGAGA